VKDAADAIATRRVDFVADTSRLATRSIASRSSHAQPFDGEVVDAAVHVRPTHQEELRKRMPKIWKGRRLPFGERYYYPNVVGDYLTESYDPDGPPASVPERVEEHLFRAGGVATAILHPYTYGLLPDEDLLAALCSATNQWLAETWLSRPEAGRRYRGTIRVAPNNVPAAVKEIEKWGGDRRFVQVGVPMQSLQTYGRRSFWPVWEAAAAHDLPVSVLTDTETGVELAPTPSGYLSTYLGFAAYKPLNFINHVTSLMVEGVFDYLPGLQFVFADGGYDFAVAMSWRMDKDYRPMRADMPWMTRLPSRYLRSNVKFVTSSADQPADQSIMAEWLAMGDASVNLLYGSHYPEWDFLHPYEAVPQAPADLRASVLAGTARTLFRL
jgi:predicted TIM-barrel fold metal-dependent hydrolase